MQITGCFRKCIIPNKVIDVELAQKRSQLERHRLLVEKDDEIVKLRERVKSASEKKFENGTITMSELIDDINAENLARQTRNQHQTH